MIALQCCDYHFVPRIMIGVFNSKLNRYLKGSTEYGTTRWVLHYLTEPFRLDIDKIRKIQREYHAVRPEVERLI